jgi:hypothetical protein
MNFNFSLLSLLAFCLPFSLIGKRAESTWRDLLASHANCVTWVSATVRLEISAGGRSLPPQEQKLEALGTIIAEDGLTVLSLSRVDPTASLLARMRTPGASVNVNYTEVLILMQDGTEVPAKLVLKDTDLDLAFVLPIKQKEDNEEFKDVVFSHVPRSQKEKSKLPQALDEVVSLGKLGRNLYRQSTLRKGWVNAVIEKPRKYFVIENTSPGTPVFDREGGWLGIVVYKMDRGRPTSLVTLPADDIDEIAEQVRSRHK